MILLCFSWSDYISYIYFLAHNVVLGLYIDEIEGGSGAERI